MINNEIAAIKELGEKIGYGNMMDIASALWANTLKVDTEATGAFVPVCLYQLKKHERTRAMNRLNLMRGYVKN